MNKEQPKYFNFPIVLLEGFLDNTKDCLDNIWDYALYIQSQKYEWIIDEDRISSADKYFGVRTGDKQKTYDNGEGLFESIPPKTPTSKINISVWFEYYNNKKTEFEKVCLLANIAILSTNKGKPYSKVEKHFLYSRMDGKVKKIGSDLVDEKLIFPDPKVTNELSEKIKKYATHRYWQKIKKELVENWYWFIPTTRPVINKNGKLVEIRIKGINYFTQLDGQTFYKGLITEEKNKFENTKKKEQILSNLIKEYNN